MCASCLSVSASTLLVKPKLGVKKEELAVGVVGRVAGVGHVQILWHNFRYCALVDGRARAAGAGGALRDCRISSLCRQCGAVVVSRIHSRQSKCEGYACPCEKLTLFAQQPLPVVFEDASSTGASAAPGGGNSSNPALRATAYKCVDALGALESIPSIAVLKEPDRLAQLSPAALQLLDFVLHPDTVSLRKVGVANWLKQVPGAAALPPSLRPDAVLELEHGRMRDEYPNALGRAKHAEFSKAAQAFPLMTAYHGTDLCNVYNILRESLKNDKHLAGRNGQIFGKGIYLSEDPVVATNFLSYGRGWKHAQGWRSLACLLECEVVCDPTAVLHGRDETGRMPMQYVLVQNDCLVRVKRVLVYGERPTPPSDYRWLAKWLLMFCVVALVLLATWKNASARRALTRFAFAK